MPGPGILALRSCVPVCGGDHHGPCAPAPSPLATKQSTINQADLLIKLTPDHPVISSRAPWSLLGTATKAIGRTKESLHYT